MLMLRINLITAEHEVVLQTDSDGSDTDFMYVGQSVYISQQTNKRAFHSFLYIRQ